MTFKGECVFEVIIIFLLCWDVLAPCGSDTFSPEFPLKKTQLSWKLQRLKPFINNSTAFIIVYLLSLTFSLSQTFILSPLLHVKPLWNSSSFSPACVAAVSSLPLSVLVLFYLILQMLSAAFQASAPEPSWVFSLLSFCCCWSASTSPATSWISVGSSCASPSTSVERPALEPRARILRRARQRSREYLVPSVLRFTKMLNCFDMLRLLLG